MNYKEAWCPAFVQRIANSQWGSIEGENAISLNWILFYVKLGDISS